VTEQKYRIYGGELSYFTRKLEAAFIFYGIDFELRDKNAQNREEIEHRSGTHQIPVLQTPENWMIADTTPIIEMLDHRFPERRLFPAGKLGVAVHILEEYFDEWIARTMVHYRWNKPRSAEFASQRMAGGDPEFAAQLRGWGPKACRATGVSSEVQQRAAEVEYRRILEAMEAQLGQTAYLLGDRPTVVDCVLLGGLRAHIYMDPDPKEMMAGYPRVVAWCEGGADRWDGEGELAAFPALTNFAQFVLLEIVATYQPFALANRDAQAAQAKAFEVEIYGENVSYLSRPYVERSRRLILARITNQFTAPERLVILDWLEGCRLTCFLPD
jgi:glutathione S-transferase